MTSTQKGVGGVLKFVTCLSILLFLNNRSIVHFCGCWEYFKKLMYDPSLFALILKFQCNSYFIEKKLIITNQLDHLITQTAIQSEIQTTFKIAEIPSNILDILQLKNMLETTNFPL